MYTSDIKNNDIVSIISKGSKQYYQIIDVNKQEMRQIRVCGIGWIPIPVLNLFPYPDHIISKYKDVNGELKSGRSKMTKYKGEFLNYKNSGDKAKYDKWMKKLEDDPKVPYSYIQSWLY